MMFYLLQYPSLKIPYSCCKLNDGAKAKSLKEKDVVDWAKCVKEYDEGLENTDQLNNVVSVFLNLCHPANLNSIVSKACLECECFHYNSSISLVHFTHTQLVIKHIVARYIFSANVF